VYLCSGEKEQLGELQAEETIWITNIQLEKGIHSFWLKAIDNQGVEAWYDLGSVNAVNDLTTEPETGGSGSTGNNKMQDAIRDTLISVILTTPVAGVVVYRRRNARKQEVK
jgi:imidazole glycerol phosphate synthase subunit HisF